MNIHDLIKTRRSVFPAQYTEEPVSKGEINQLLEAANWAPTHKKTEPWRFKVLRDKKTEFADFLVESLKTKSEKPLSEFKQDKIRKKFNQSSAVIVIFMQRDKKERIPEWEEISATAMAVQNMWLTATDLGIGSYWSSPRKLIPLASDYFNLTENERCLGFLYIGNYDTELLDGERSPVEEKVEWM